MLGTAERSKRNQLTAEACAGLTGHPGAGGTECEISINYNYIEFNTAISCRKYA